MGAIDRDDGDRRDDEERERADDHGSRAHAVVEPAADEGAEASCQHEEDSEHAELDRRPAEYSGSVNSAEGEERHEPVGIDHVGEDESENVAVAAGMSEGREELGDA